MSTGLKSSETSDEDPLKCSLCFKDVVNPVLLNCLHSVCGSCTGGHVARSVTCPRCKVTTDKPTGRVNLIVSSLARRSLVLKDVFSCTQCTDKDNQRSIAVLWCYTCQYSLCLACKKRQSSLHYTHKMMHLNEHTNLSELYKPPARLCRKHSEELKLACFTCKDGRCYKCAHDCYTCSHAVLPLDSPDALKRTEDIVTQAMGVLSELNSTLKPLHAHLNLTDKVRSAREDHLSTLMKTKKTAIDLISNAYENAAKTLLECWRSVEASLLPYRAVAECIKARVSWTNVYCKMVLSSNDIVGLLPQLDAVLSSLQTRLKEAKQFEEPVDPSERVRFNTWLPNDLDLMASDWFGQATVLSDDFKCSRQDFPKEDGNDYYKRKVSTLKELELLIQNQKKQQETAQREARETAEKLQLELTAKDRQLAATQNEVKKLLEQKKERNEQLERERATMVQLQSDLTTKAKQLVSIRDELKKLLEQQQKQNEQLERERMTVQQLQSDITTKAKELVETQNDVKKLLEQQKEQNKQLERERMTVQQLQFEITNKATSFGATQNDVQMLQEHQKKQNEQLERECRTVQQMQSDFTNKAKQLVAIQNLAKKLLEQQKEQNEQLERECVTVQQLQTDITTKAKQLVATQNDVKMHQENQKKQNEQLEGECRTVQQLQLDFTTKAAQRVSTQNEVKKLFEQQKEQNEQLERERMTVQQLQLELIIKEKDLEATQNSAKTIFDERTKLLGQVERERKTVVKLEPDRSPKSQPLDLTKDEVKKLLLEKQWEQQEQRGSEPRTVEQQTSAIITETQPLAAATKPLSFDSKERGTFKGPGLCWDLAVTSQGRLLLAAMADGMKEYDATSYREMATWQPNSHLLGQEKRFFVRTVDVLSDSRAVVGLDPQLVVLLRRDVMSGSGTSNAVEAWRVERRIAQLQAPPRQLSAWRDRLLAVLEDRYDENAKSWRCGPGLVLLSLCGNGKQLHRQQLDYDACSVAMTDRCVLVASSSAVELTDAVSSEGGKRKWNVVEGTGKCFVVDCYSHLGVRLWRQAMAATSLCADSVGRVLYAAKSGSVAAHSIDDGSELSTAIALSTTGTERSQAVALNKSIPRLLAVISLDDKRKPNIIRIFSVV